MVLLKPYASLIGFRLPFVPPELVEFADVGLFLPYQAEYILQLSYFGHFFWRCLSHYNTLTSTFYEKLQLLETLLHVVGLSTTSIGLDH